MTAWPSPSHTKPTGTPHRFDRSRPTAEVVPRPEIELPPLTSRSRRLFKHPLLRHHNRLVALVLAANLACAGYGIADGGIATDTLADAAIANFAVAILIRQQYVINLLFRMAGSAPVSWPLRIRWTLGKVYHYGGLHIGGGVAGAAWSLALTGVLIRHADQVDATTLAISCALAAIVILMVFTALPRVRNSFHDRFEQVHRFGGWTVLILVWAQTARSASKPSLWVLALLTLSIALPWSRLRRVPVVVERPSAHIAIAHFDYRATPWPGSATNISRDPLREWHTFANLPPAADGTGFRLTISRAGDWTGAFIDDPPTHLWVRGVPTAGVAYIEKLFRRVVYVATGSGIGPCLYHLISAQVPAKLVWATRDPRATYGDAMVDEILGAHPDALLWDTTEHGKPDMVRLAYAAYRDFDAEAVICISNKRLTWEVVHGLESRGVPAFGAIWDS